MEELMKAKDEARFEQGSVAEFKPDHATNQLTGPKVGIGSIIRSPSLHRQWIACTVDEICPLHQDLLSSIT